MEFAVMLEDMAGVDVVVGNLEVGSGEDFQGLRGKMKLPISRTQASFLVWVSLRGLHNFRALIDSHTSETFERNDWRILMAF